MRIGLLLTSAIFASSSALAFDQNLPDFIDDVPAVEKREGDDLPENIPSGLFLGVNVMSVDLSAYDHVDPLGVVPDRPLQLAMKYYDLNKSKIKNRKYVTIADFSKRSSQIRMYIIDMDSGAVRTFYVAHGLGSDIDGDGYATKFSNVEGSKMSSLGFYLTGGLYSGKHGRSMYLHGLESSNSAAYERAIVMHGADYVQPGSVGRSWGCPAIEMKYINSLLPELQGGSLLYIHYNQ